MPETCANGIYEFDDILVEPRAHRLSRGGRDVAVEPKAYAVLAALLEHAGEVMSRDALLDAVWGHRHVTPGVLNRVVTQLRRALGDEAEHPRYILTVHGLGYRFIGTLQPQVVVTQAVATTAGVVQAAPEPDRATTPSLPNDARRSSDGRLVDRRAGGHWMMWSIVSVSLLTFLVKVDAWRSSESPLLPAAPELTAAAAIPTRGQPPRTLAIAPFTEPAGSLSTLAQLDGLAQTLVDEFSVQPGLRVIGPERLAVAPGSAGGVQVIAARFAADLVLSGEVRSAGKQSMLHAELFDVGAKRVRWRREYPVGVDALLQTAMDLRTDLTEELVPGRRLPAMRPLPVTLTADAYLDSRKRAATGAFTSEDMLVSVENYRRALVADPGHARAWCRLGMAYGEIYSIGKMDLDEALVQGNAAVDRGLALDPAAADCHFAQGRLLTFTRRMPEAAAALRRALALDPELFGAQLELGGVLVSQYRPHEALLIFERAHRLRPNHAWTIAWLSRVHTDLGNGAEARRYAAELWKTPPSNRPIFAEWVPALVHQAFGEPAQAIAAMHRATDRDANDLTYALAEAEYALQIGANGVAAKALQRAGKLGWPDYWVAHCWLLLALDDPNGAVAWLRANQPNPQVARLHQALLAQSLALAGDASGADAEFRQAFAGGFADGDPLNEDLGWAADLGIGGLANWAAVKSASDQQRADILHALRKSYARKRESGFGMPTLDYQEAVLAALEGDRPGAVRRLQRAIDRGFRDGLALRRDLAWRGFTGDPGFEQQRQRLEGLMAGERGKLAGLAVVAQSASGK